MSQVEQKKQLLNGRGKVTEPDPEVMAMPRRRQYSREEVVEFDFVNTASEYVYYPQPQWTADGSHFLYSGPDFYAVGRMGAAPTEVAVGGATAAMQWLNASSFVAATGSAGVWNLQSANLAGETAALVTLNTQFAAFDVWIP